MENGTLDGAIFLTADTHFQEERAFKLIKRPFRTVEECTDAIVTNIRNTITSYGKRATLICLGDFGDYEVVKDLKAGIPYLRVVLLGGNYEDDKGLTESAALNYGFDNYVPSSHMVILDTNDMAELGSSSEQIVFKLHHIPSIALNSLPHSPNDFALFGHIHKTQMVKRRGLNVGIDCHNYSCISISDVLFWRNAILNHYDKEVFCGN